MRRVSLRRLLSLSMLGLALVPPVHAAGTPASAPVPATLSRLDAVRPILEGGDLSDAVARTAGLSGVEATQVDPVAAAPPSALPSPLAPPVLRLLEAVRGAEDALVAAVSVPPRVLRTARELMLDPRVDAPRALHDPDRWVNRSRLAGATVLLAAAIDEVLPTLSGLELDGPGDGCDVADVAPVLCVAGVGSNTLTEDYALLIDLGGDDLHLHGAGAADPGNPVTGAGNGLPVAVTIDVEGHDRYTEDLPAESGRKVAQGSGFVGGIGILVDAAGNDAYDVSGESHVYGQAYGFGGAGVLADLGGDDSYRVATVARGGAIADAQAVSGLGGLALALDAGGDDRYEVVSRSVPAIDADGESDPGSPLALGFGVAGSGGASLFADAGGSDAMAVRSIGGQPDPGSEIGFSSAIVDGFGYGFIGGAAVAAAGDGPTLWEAEVVNPAPRNNATGAVTANAMGAALSGGFGALLDEGGDDLYRVEAAVRAEHRSIVTDGCGCAAVADAVADPAIAYVMGFGEFGGIGALVDQAGDDRYEAVSSVTAVAAAADERGEPADGAALRATATARAATLYAQGVGLNGGAGLLHDASGDDAYDLRAESVAEAQAVSAHADASLEPLAEAGAARAMGQAAGRLGHGELWDTGGLDAYSSSARSDAVSSLPGTSFSGDADSAAQASVDLGGAASLADLDGGLTDVFTTLPDRPTCVGERGSGQWVDCGTGTGVGLNP